MREKLGEYEQSTEEIQKIWKNEGMCFFGCVCDFVFIIYLELTMNSRQPAGELIYVPNAGCAAGFKRSCPKIVAS